MEKLGTWTTGSRRGYCASSDRGVEGEPILISDALRDIVGNRRYNMGWALDRYPDATHYTVTPYAGTSKGYSSQYVHYVWTFYRYK